MIWYLLLAHFVGDYPLQPDWLARAKKTWRGLIIHTGVHLLVLLCIFIWMSRDALPYVFLLVMIHFGIDTSKNKLAKYKPKWVVVPYLLDQVCHVLSIIFIVNLMPDHVHNGFLPLDILWIKLLLGYLLVTYFWFITERVTLHTNKEYVKSINSQQWQRMSMRAIWLTCFLLAGEYLQPVVFVSAIAFQLPYKQGKHSRRALLTDIVVALIVMIFIRLIS